MRFNLPIRICEMRFNLRPFINHPRVNRAARCLCICRLICQWAFGKRALIYALLLITPGLIEQLVAFVYAV